MANHKALFLYSASPEQGEAFRIWRLVRQRLRFLICAALACSQTKIVTVYDREVKLLVFKVESRGDLLSLLYLSK
jgi:hypothetical protein